MIGWYPSQLIRELDPASRVARFADGTEMPFDLFLGVPVHHVPAVVAESGMTVDGWIPVNPLTLETSFPGVFAVGDVTSVGTPKAGVFSERQAAVAADRIISAIRGGPGTSEYDGYGMCYLEFGHDEVARVEVRFVSGQAPTGSYDAPSGDARGGQGGVRNQPHPQVVRSRVAQRSRAGQIARALPARRAYGAGTAGRALRAFATLSATAASAAASLRNAAARSKVSPTVWPAS